MSDMKVFTTAFEDTAEEDAREERILARIEESKKEGNDPIGREEAEVLEDGGKIIPFELDGREMRAFPPTDGQLVFLMATMGRGQSNEQRFAAIINIMVACLREEDRRIFEERLLERDRKKRLKPEMIEDIFFYLSEEWFGRPTK